MTVRIYYLRDNENIRTRDDGSRTRGNPVACVVTDVNKENGTIRYAVSTVHPDYLFDKTLAKRIATGRLTKKPITLQGVPASGHDITLKVMQDIVKNTTAITLRALADEWVKAAVKPKKRSVSDSIE